MLMANISRAVRAYVGRWLRMLGRDCGRFDVTNHATNHRMKISAIGIQGVHQ